MDFSNLSLPNPYDVGKDIFNNTKDLVGDLPNELSHLKDNIGKGFKSFYNFSKQYPKDIGDNIKYLENSVLNPFGENINKSINTLGDNVRKNTLPLAFGSGTLIVGGVVIAIIATRVL